MKNFIMSFVGVSVFFFMMSIPIVNTVVVAMFASAMIVGIIRYIKAQM